MDYKQKNILKKICDNNAIPKNKMIFKQYRNLKEFKYFIIERINPNHIIQVKGVLKNKYIHDNNYNKIINVGEIVIFSSIVMFVKSDIFLFWLNSFILSAFLFELILVGNPIKVLKIGFNWYRRGFRFRKNNNCC